MIVPGAIKIAKQFFRVFRGESSKSMIFKKWNDKSVLLLH